MDEFCFRNFYTSFSISCDTNVVHTTFLRPLCIDSNANMVSLHDSLLLALYHSFVDTAFHQKSVITIPLSPLPPADIACRPPPIPESIPGPSSDSISVHILEHTSYAADWLSRIYKEMPCSSDFCQKFVSLIVFPDYIIAFVIEHGATGLLFYTLSLSWTKYHLNPIEHHCSCDL